MKRIPVLILSAILPAFAGTVESARAASADLPGCAAARMDAFHPTGSGFSARRVTATAAAAPGATLHAAILQASGQGLDQAGLQQAATAAEAAMLLAAAHVRNACPGTGAQALARALRNGGSADFSWTDVSVAAKGERFGARSATLHARGVGASTALTLHLSGVVSNVKDAALLPEEMDLAFSLPSDRVPSLLAGGTPTEPVPVTIDRAELRRGDATMSGSGSAQIAGTPQQSEADGHLVIHNYDALMQSAGDAGLQKVQAAMFIGKLMAKHEGDGLSFDLHWGDGAFTVNNVPMPLH